METGHGQILLPPARKKANEPLVGLDPTGNKHQEVRGCGLNNTAIKTNSEGHDILSVLSIYRANRRFQISLKVIFFF